MADKLEASDNPAVFTDLTPANFQKLFTELTERLEAQLPDMVGMVRLRGRWGGSGKELGPYLRGASVVDDGGTKAMVDIPIALLKKCGVVPGQDVIVSGRLGATTNEHGVWIRVDAGDIELEAREEPPQGAMTLDLLRTLPLDRVLFPVCSPVSVSLIHPSVGQTAKDCLAELDQLGGAVNVDLVSVDMRAPEQIAASIRASAASDITIIVRRKSKAEDFNALDDPCVIAALAELKTHRVLGTGGADSRTLLDLVADHSAGTPAEAGAYVREQIQLMQRLSEKSHAADELNKLKQQNKELTAEIDCVNEQLTKTHEISKNLGSCLEKEKEQDEQLRIAREQIERQQQELDAARMKAQEKELAAIEALKGKIAAWALVPAFLLGAVLVWFAR